MNVEKNFSIYNNMYFRTSAGKMGYIKADSENIVLFSLDEYTLSRTTGERMPKAIARGFIPSEVTLIPRNPETFNEFRVGDVLVKRSSDTRDGKGALGLIFVTVVARFANTIVLENLGNFKEVTDIYKAFASGWRLNPTCFEQKLLKETLNEKSSVTPAIEKDLEKGDIVIFKRAHTDGWSVGKFNSYNSYTGSCAYVDFLLEDGTLDESILVRRVLKLTPERIGMIGMD